MDIVKELRLRRWARENYVLPDQRSNRWDAVILNEMESMDRDIAEQKQNHEWLSAYAPVLAQGGIEQHRKVHQAHRDLVEPNFLNDTISEQSELFIG